MNKSLVLTVLFLFVFLSCDDNANKSKIDAQVKKNEPLYLSEKTTSSVLSKPVNDEDYSDFMRTPNGLLYKFYVINEGVTLTNDDVVEIRMNYFLNDSLLFSSQNFPKRFDMPVESSVFKGDFYEGIFHNTSDLSKSFSKSFTSNGFSGAVYALQLPADTAERRQSGKEYPFL